MITGPEVQLLAALADGLKGEYQTEEDLSWSRSPFGWIRGHGCASVGGQADAGRNPGVPFRVDEALPATGRHRPSERPPSPSDRRVPRIRMHGIPQAQRHDNADSATAAIVLVAPAVLSPTHPAQEHDGP